MVYYINVRPHIHDFYIRSNAGAYYLFGQTFRNGVHQYFEKGIQPDEALDRSSCR